MNGTTELDFGVQWRKVEGKGEKAKGKGQFAK